MTLYPYLQVKDKYKKGTKDKGLTTVIRKETDQYTRPAISTESAFLCEFGSDNEIFKVCK